MTLNPIDLTTTLRTVPRNGAPSSLDWNDSFREILGDLSVLATFLNEQVQPILQALPTTASAGLDGSSVYANKISEEALFRNPFTNEPYTVADVFTALQKTQSALIATNQDLQAKVNQLQTRFSASSQNDTTRVIQTFADRLNAAELALSEVLASAQASLAKVNRIQHVRLATGTITANATATLTITWPVSYGSNAYTVSLALQQAQSDLTISRFDYINTDGTALQVVVKNNTSQDRSGTVHAIAKAD